MFSTALPYGAITLGVGIVGAITAVAATSTIGMIMGIVLGILGGYAFFGVVLCGITSRTSKDYHKNIWTCMAGTGLLVISEIVKPRRRYHYIPFPSSNRFYKSSSNSSNF